MEYIFGTFCFSLLLTSAEGQACSASTWQYGTTPFTDYNTADTTMNARYLMDSVDYAVPEDCTCGVLWKWHLYPAAAGPVQLQVWEPVDSNLYVLKGENYLTVTASGVGQQIEFTVPVKYRTIVRNGYKIGWYGASSGVIGWKNDSTDYPDEQKQRASTSDLVVGASADWSDSTVTTFNYRVYAIGASVMANTAPGFTNLPRTVRIYRTTTAGSFLYQPTADDVDEDDVSSLTITATADPASSYYYNQTTGFVRLGDTTPSVGQTKITFTVTDQCGNSNTADLTIQVYNWSPSLTSLPAFATISETTSIEQELGAVAISDDDDTSFTVSSGLTVDPASANIQLKSYGFGAGNQTIVTVEGASWSYTAAQQYIMDITLQDPEGATTDTGYFLLYITKNDPPKFTNLDNAAMANASYLTTSSGDLIYTVSATDAESDALTFTLTCTACPFTMQDNAIYASEDLIRKYVPGYDLLIDVSDGTTTLDQKTLTVIIEDIDDQPSISNLPLEHPLVVLEGTSLDTVLFTVTWNDLDTADTHNVQATYDQTWAINYFYLNSSSGVLTTAYNVLNFEELAATAATTVTLNITVSDGQDWDSNSLTINVGDVNEAPSFHQTSYRLTPAEQGAYNASAGSPGFEVSDPDAGDSLSLIYSWDCATNSRYFYMDATGAVTYAAVFDYDTSTVALPYNCTVTLTDSGGLTATTVLQIDIQDTNDNTPTFSQTTDYVLVQPHTLGAGRFVGQVSASDADRSDKYGTVYYSFLTTPPQFAKSYLYINDYGNIYVNETWTDSAVFDYGKSYVLTVLATNAVDDTGARLAATATVTLLLPGTSTTVAVTTDRPLAFEQDPRNVAWLSVAAGLFLALMVVGCGLVCVYTVQVKRYRWCLPWCRKRLLDLQKYTRRQKRLYYMDVLEREALEKQARDQPSSSSSDYDSDEEYWAAEMGGRPPAISEWAGREGGGGGGRGLPGAGRSSHVPRAAQYDEPKPPLKRALSRMLLQKGGPRLFDQ